MLIGEQGKTENRFLDMCSLSQAAQSHGHQRSKQQRLYRPLKQNISPWFKQQKNPSGSKDFSENLVIRQSTQTSFTEITKVSSLSQTTLNTMQGPSTLIFNITLFGNAFKTTKSPSNIVPQPIWLLME